MKKNRKAKLKMKRMKRTKNNPAFRHDETGFITRRGPYEGWFCDMRVGLPRIYEPDVSVTRIPDECVWQEVCRYTARCVYYNYTEFCDIEYLNDEDLVDGNCLATWHAYFYGRDIALSQSEVCQPDLEDFQSVEPSPGPTIWGGRAPHQGPAMNQPVYDSGGPLDLEPGLHRSGQGERRTPSLLWRVLQGAGGAYLAVYGVLS